MSKIQSVLDTVMCMMWITTYTLVLIGTLKYRYPLISPITQAIIAPFEFSVVFLFAKLGISVFNYGFIAYLYWAIIEIAIFRAIEKLGYIKKCHVKPYIMSVLIITLAMLYLVTIKGNMFFFSYFNTFLGMLVWAHFICNEDYPMNGFSLAIFITKLIADILGLIVYYGDGSWIISLISVLLPIVDFIFILIWFIRRTKYKNGIEKQRLAAKEGLA